MDRMGIVLAAMSAGGTAEYSPVQIQKLMFLLDHKAPEATGGPFFQFAPYHYGPFDKAVYDVLEEAAAKQLVSIDSSKPWRTYRLTEQGLAAGRENLATISPKGKEYIERLVSWLRRLSFQDLVKAVYREYPEMRENSVFQG